MISHVSNSVHKEDTYLTFVMYDTIKIYNVQYPVCNTLKLLVTQTTHAESKNVCLYKRGVKHVTSM
jgi:hypothetical protein